VTPPPARRKNPPDPLFEVHGLGIMGVHDLFRGEPVKRKASAVWTGGIKDGGGVISSERGFGVTGVHLDVAAKVPGADPQAFRTAATAAKEGCPISKLLKAPITMDAKLEG